MFGGMAGSNVMWCGAGESVQCGTDGSPRTDCRGSGGPFRPDANAIAHVGGLPEIASEVVDIADIAPVRSAAEANEMLKKYGGFSANLRHQPAKAQAKRWAAA